MRYVYDSLNRLIREDNGFTNETYVYSYDDAGNVLELLAYPLTAAEASPPALFEKSGIELEYSTSAWGDIATSINGHTIIYDEIGNPTSYYNGQSYTFSWVGRQLEGATLGSDVYTFAHDDAGFRTSKTKNGVTTNYYYDGSLLVAEETDGNITVYIYDAEGSPIGMQYHGASYASGVWDCYWYEKNLLGDIVAVYNNSGTKLVSYVYDAWGVATVTYSSGGESTTAASNPFRYRGYYYDIDLGLYRTGTRYYDAVVGRFINSDNQLSTGDLTGMNLFAYCGNNPVNRIDPAGEAWWHWAIGAAIVAACAVAAVVTCGGVAAAVGAVAAVGSGVAAATTASTVAAGAFIGSAVVYGATAVIAASTSDSIQEFNDKGNWGTVAATLGGAAIGGMVAYTYNKTTVYRSVSNAEAQDIKKTGRFNLSSQGMEAKQFGFNLAETRKFGNAVGQNIIVSARVPTSMLNQLYTNGVDTTIFRNGTLTVYSEQLALFNQAVQGTIKFIP